MQHYDTLSQAIEGLKKRGYTEDFNLKENCIECRRLNYEILTKDFEVDEVHRFEGDTNPADSSVLYAISAENYDIKGVLVDAYGTYAGEITREMIEKLRYKPKNLA